VEAPQYRSVSEVWDLLMRTRQDILNYWNNLKNEQLSSAVEGFPPGYVVGFEFTIDKQNVVVGPGAANVRGKSVVNNVPTVVSNPEVMVGDSTYYVYLDSLGEMHAVDTEPVFDAGHFGRFHPEYSWLYLGSFFYSGTAEAPQLSAPEDLVAPNLELTDSPSTFTGRELSYYDAFSQQERLKFGSTGVDFEGGLANGGFQMDSQGNLRVHNLVEGLKVRGTDEVEAGSKMTLAGETITSWDDVGGGASETIPWVYLNQNTMGYGSQNVSGGAVIMFGAGPPRLSSNGGDYYAYDAANSHVEILQAGVYRIDFEVSLDITSGSSRSVAEHDLQIDRGSGFLDETEGGRTWSYHRTNGASSQTATGVVIVELSAGDKVRLRSQRIAGSDTLYTRQSGVNLALSRMDAIKGDKGDPGTVTADTTSGDFEVAGNLTVGNSIVLNGVYVDDWSQVGYSGGDFHVTGALSVDSGILVKGSDYHGYNGIRASSSNNGHLMLDPYGSGNTYINWDNRSSDLRVYGSTTFYNNINVKGKLRTEGNYLEVPAKWPDSSVPTPPSGYLHVYFDFYNEGRLIVIDENRDGYSLTWDRYNVDSRRAYV
jgi:hypothetical protein